ncbi:MAG TPA: bifunctional DNA-binding transcriptional regulator/O6-methylguanine-DNA methyltransferase Ada [Vicinamibacterales bacterium]|nr:bifunctional DNA-binding transcriptional regulator/O6-methylguanine-DNA methyltransferase Ada [Vicinamibacterales bacterium]
MMTETHSVTMQANDMDAGDARRWRAVLARDASADGTFVYAVRSTGIYCRPTCASRRPRPEQVAFFADGAAAERAGFRPCRRCRPSQPAAGDPWIDRVRQACRLLARHEDEPVTLETLSRTIGGSPHHLQRNFKRIMGVSPREYAEACRLARVKRNLKAGEAVTAALYDAGYGSSSRLYERAPAQLGMTPASYSRGGAGAEIRYAVTACPLGRLLVAATSRGVCAIKMGTDDAVLERELRHEFPAATIQPDAGRLSQHVRKVLAHLEGRRPALELPLDVQATAFQWQVWRQLVAIPRGATRSYGEIAAAIGRPRAARAVARACASNPVALAIPCHRVVPAGGGTGGYRWGAERKKALLGKEKGEGLERGT